MHMLNCDSETLDEILGLGKLARYMKRIGFYYDSLKSKSKFVPHVKKTDSIMSNYKSQHHVRHYYQHSNVYTRTSWVCHYYGQ